MGRSRAGGRAETSGSRLMRQSTAQGPRGRGLGTDGGRAALTRSPLFQELLPDPRARPGSLPSSTHPYRAQSTKCLMIDCETYLMGPN